MTDVYTNYLYRNNLIKLKVHNEDSNKNKFKFEFYNFNPYINEFKFYNSDPNCIINVQWNVLTGLHFQIYRWLDSLVTQYPNIVKPITGGSSYEGRSIRGVKLSYKEGNPGIFMEGGIHAREWISPAVVTYILNELILSDDSRVRYMAESYDWYFFPVFNPDGYEYTHTRVRKFSSINFTFITTIQYFVSQMICYDIDRFENFSTVSSISCLTDYRGYSISKYLLLVRLLNQCNVTYKSS